MKLWVRSPMRFDPRTKGDLSARTSLRVSIVDPSP
jgi:hypothetical protein